MNSASMRASAWLDFRLSPASSWSKKVNGEKRRSMAGYRCDHIHLRSADCEAAARFYEQMFGAAPVFRREVNGMLRIGLDLNGLSLFIDQVPDGTPKAPPPPYIGLEHICLAVEGLDAAAEALRRKGVTFVTEPRELRPGVRYAFIEAPDGVRIELIDRAA